MDKKNGNIKQALKVGNITINGNNNPVVIGPGTSEIVHCVRTSNPDLADALTLVLGHLEETKNEEAGVIFDKFSEQLNRDKVDKTILKALWGSVIKTAPALKSMADATAAITKLF